MLCNYLKHIQIAEMAVTVYSSVIVLCLKSMSRHRNLIKYGNPTNEFLQLAYKT